MVSSLAFAAGHLSLPEAVPLTVLGVCLGVTARAADGNLLAPMLAHGLYNGAILFSVLQSSS